MRNFRSECHFNPGTRTNTLNERTCYGNMWNIRRMMSTYCKNVVSENNAMTKTQLPTFHTLSQVHFE